jgi:hypothetical protein
VSGFFAHHGLHLAVGIAPLVISFVVLVPETLSARSTPRDSSRLALSASLVVAALGTAGAAAVHATIIRQHFHESWIYGSFFVVAVVAQVAVTIGLLVRPSRRFVGAVLVGSLAIIALWAVTRTLGVPLGPNAGSTEPVGGLDLLAGAFELLTVAGCAWSLWTPRPVSWQLSPMTVDRYVAVGMRPPAELVPYDD